MSENAKNQAVAQLESIRKLLKELKKAEKKGDDAAIEKAMEAIQEDPLSIQVRSDWHNPGEELGVAKYNILLCTGGPAVRIVGDLTLGMPCTAYLQFQDWYEPWTEYQLSEKESKDVLEYASQFYFES